MLISLIALPGGSLGGHQSYCWKFLEWISVLMCKYCVTCYSILIHAWYYIMVIIYNTQSSPTYKVSVGHCTTSGLTVSQPIQTCILILPYGPGTRLWGAASGSFSDTVQILCPSVPWKTQGLIFKIIPSTNPHNLPLFPATGQCQLQSTPLPAQLITDSVYPRGLSSLLFCYCC